MVKTKPADIILWVYEWYPIVLFILLIDSSMMES